MMNEQQTKLAETTDWRWLAVEKKNGEFDGVFYFGVQTTGIFCRPSCSSRPPKRKNVSFFVTTTEAESAGFRACLRCKPKNLYEPGPAAVMIRKAFGLLRSEELEIASIEDLSRRLNVSPGHLQKTFKAVLGLSPKEVLDMMRLENFKRNVRETDVTTSLYESGFGSSRALYEKAGKTLGMTPATYKKGGMDMKINYTIVDTRLGKLMVAATEKGICSVSFGDTAGELESGLRQEFFAATRDRNESDLKDAVDTILRSLDGEKAILKLQLDLHASAFQLRVWAELRKIPYGETRSYGQIAASLGTPKSFRAVARACATNPVALVNPCHRVVASDGKLSGYKWGIERKAELLKQEKSKI
ncbi:bifunctional DNA-binding transcriptional regulator/O6-methylguanine-DNA methyltransferase Ada [soil metagenome]